MGLSLNKLEVDLTGWITSCKALASVMHLPLVAMV